MKKPPLSPPLPPACILPSLAPQAGALPEASNSCAGRGGASSVRGTRPGAKERARRPGRRLKACPDGQAPVMSVRTRPEDDSSRPAIGPRRQVSLQGPAFGSHLEAKARGKALGRGGRALRPGITGGPDYA